MDFHWFKCFQLCIITFLFLLKSSEELSQWKTFWMVELSLQHFSQTFLKTFLLYVHNKMFQIIFIFLWLKTWDEVFYKEFSFFKLKKKLVAKSGHQGYQIVLCEYRLELQFFFSKTGRYFFLKSLVYIDFLNNLNPQNHLKIYSIVKKCLVFFPT